MEKLTSQSWKEILAAAAAVFEENCEFLCGLDAQMGDGDLGLTMKKGYAIGKRMLVPKDRLIVWIDRNTGGDHAESR